MNYQQGNQESGVAKVINGLGKASGIAAAILGTPTIFNATHEQLLAFLSKTWGEDLAGLLIWVLAGAAAYALYAVTVLLVSVGIVAAMAAWAAHRFSRGG